MSPIKMSRVEAAVRVVIQLIDQLNSHSIAHLGELLSEDVILEDLGPAPVGQVYTGRPDVLLYFNELVRRKPGLALETEELFGFGNRCVFRWLAKEPSGETCQRGVTLFLLREGRIFQILSYGKN